MSHTATRLEQWVVPQAGMQRSRESVWAPAAAARSLADPVPLAAPAPAVAVRTPGRAASQPGQESHRSAQPLPPLPPAYTLHKISAILSTVAQLAVALAQLSSGAGTASVQAQPLVVALFLRLVTAFVSLRPHMYWTNRCVHTQPPCEIHRHSWRPECWSPRPLLVTAAGCGSSRPSASCFLRCPASGAPAWALRCC